MVASILFVVAFGFLGVVLLVGAKRSARWSGDAWAGWIVGGLLVAMAANEFLHLLQRSGGGA